MLDKKDEIFIASESHQNKMWDVKKHDFSNRTDKR